MSVKTRRWICKVPECQNSGRILVEKHMYFLHTRMLKSTEESTVIHNYTQAINYVLNGQENLIYIT